VPIEPPARNAGIEGPWLRPICDQDVRESPQGAAQPRRMLPSAATDARAGFPCVSHVSAVSRRPPRDAPDRIRTCDLRFRRPLGWGQSGSESAGKPTADPVEADQRSRVGDKVRDKERRPPYRLNDVAQARRIAPQRPARSSGVVARRRRTPVPVDVIHVLDVGPHALFAERAADRQRDLRGRALSALGGGQTASAAPFGRWQSGRYAEEDTAMAHALRHPDPVHRDQSVR
jgi:hypothetical protein